MSPAASAQPDLSHWQGEPVGVWEALWGVPRFEVWSQLGSTNDRARDLARTGAPPWTVVVALRQTEGRGRAGRVWQSERGAGLWVSFVLRPRARAQGQLLPLLAGLALARAIEAPASDAATLKWPNDVWVSGRKVAGILCETAGDDIVVGLGVNLRSPEGGFAEAHASRAGTLEGTTGRNWSESWVLGRIIRELRSLWQPPRLRFEEDLVAEWRERDLLEGRRVRVGTVVGRARGLTGDGALRIETPAGDFVPVRAGHVEWSGEIGSEDDSDLAEE